MKDEYNEYYKISDHDAFYKIQGFKKSREDWIKSWNNHAEWLGFDKAYIVRDHSCLGFFQARLQGFAVSFEKLHTIDMSIYKLVSVDKHKKLNIYTYRKGNKKEYAKFKNIYESIGLVFNLNSLGKYLFPDVDNNNYPVGTMHWNENGCFLVRVVWFGRKKSETRMHQSLTRIKESEYLAIQGK